MMKQAMLLNNLYTLLSFRFSEDKTNITASILLNSEHPVFKGHFPGNPILPGVCTVQIIRELVESALGRELTLSRAGSIKYIGFISPVSTPEIQLECHIREGGTGIVICTATVSDGVNTLCSFKGEFNSHVTGDS
jgi:3-hydroxyacyl-[acyl-carrier-protein] dehydratase